jgi:hypothetical protein
MRRSLRFLAAAASALPALAGAQQVNFVGSTLGCFYKGVGGSCAPSLFSQIGTVLSYNSGTFNIYTDPAGTSGTSFGAVGSVGTPDSHGSISSSGIFSQTAATAPANKWFLRLQTTVTGPLLDGNHNNVTGEVGDNVFTNDFSIVGSTRTTAVGGLRFTPINPIIYTGIYSDGHVLGFPFPKTSAAGTVDYWAYDTQSITSGHTATLSSFIQITSTVTSTPEPATVGLTALGLLALVGVARRRRADA